MIISHVELCTNIHLISNFVTLELTIDMGADGGGVQENTLLHIEILKTPIQLIAFKNVHMSFELTFEYKLLDVPKLKKLRIR